MLPEALSAGLCSLKPGEDRACLAAHLQIDAEGTVRDWRFERALMRSAARLTYDGVQEAVERGGDGLAGPGQTTIPALYGVYGALRAARERRGALDLDLPERVVTLTDDGAVAHIGFARRFDSHRLIEELMIAANVAAASALEAKHMPCMYRVHDRPDTAKLETLREFLRSRGLALPRGGAVRPDAFNRFLALLEDPRDVGVASLMILRAQARAAYSPRNIGHFGLGLVRYAHFTSPIRRYADLLVHRALIDAYGLGPGGSGRGEEEALEPVGAHISSTERRAQAGGARCPGSLLRRLPGRSPGAEFHGRIAGVTRFGVFVSLDETGAEGLVPARTLGANRPRFDARRQTLDVDGRTLCLGDPVVVSLQEADPIAGGLTFSLIAVDGEAWAAADRQRGRRGRPRRRR